MKHHSNARPNGKEGQRRAADERSLVSGASVPRAKDTIRRMPYSDRYDYDGRLDDPEYVWKKQREWERLSGGSDEERSWMSPPSPGLVRAKLIVSALLFALVWGMFRLDDPWALKGQQYVREALNKDYDFSQAAAWYEKTFQGAPSFIPTFGDKKEKRDAQEAALLSKNFYTPVQGSISMPFASTQKGILVKTQAGAPVSALDTGIVVFVGETEQNGLTVVIQHANGFQSVYGKLAETRFQKNDWVKGGEQIGKVSGETETQNGSLYFAVTRNNTYIDPAEVISFD